MYILEKIKQNIIDTINEKLNTNLILNDLSYPPNSEMGDLSLPLFNIAKKINKTPQEVGNLIISKIEAGEIINEFKIIGPYLNFFINKNFLAKNTILNIQKYDDNYGENDNGQKEKVLIEFANGNTHKEFHVGHLRNICYGDSVTKILNTNGYKATPISYINDFGIHVAKTLANYDDYLNTNSISTKLTKKEKGELLGKIYTDAATREKNDENFKEKVGLFMKEIESKQGEKYKLWKETREWSIEHFNNIYKKLDIKFKNIFYESENIENGLKIVDNLLKEEILRRSDGAIIADLTEYDLNILVILRSNGTATYPVADLSLASNKNKQFSPSKSIYIVDVRQSLYFKQLFKLLELAGHKEKLIHLPYDFLKLPSGMMSSRSGNVITFNSLYEELLKRSGKEIRKRHTDWSEKQIQETAETIGLGAIKFEMLKVDSKNIITFDMDSALSFDGFTSSYIQYAYARIQSIFKKHNDYKFKVSEKTLEKLNTKEELELLKKLIKYPEVVREAGEKYNPSEIAKYTYELTKLFNDYYHKTSILNSNEEEKKARLSLLASISQVIKNGLELLGIKTINEM